MYCCHSQSANRLFSKLAKRYRKRFKRKGLEAPQKTLFQALLEQGVTQATILEVGCGVGQFHQALLEKGAASAIGIDLAEEMISEAKDWAKERGMQERTEYRVGDYMQMTGLPKQDITIMDKVICCYPDGQGMVDKALQGTSHLALVYPRDRKLVRLGIALGALLMKLVGSDFRPYFHSPKHVMEWAASRHFTRQYSKSHLIWLVEIYARD